MAGGAVIGSTELSALGSVAMIAVVTAVAAEEGMAHLMQECSKHSSRAMLMARMMRIQQNHYAIRLNESPALFAAVGAEEGSMERHDGGREMIEEEKGAENAQWLREELGIRLSKVWSRAKRVIFLGVEPPFFPSLPCMQLAET